MFAYTNQGVSKSFFSRDISAKRVKILRYTVSSATILDLKNPPMHGTSEKNTTWMPQKISKRLSSELQPRYIPFICRL